MRLRDYLAIMRKRWLLLVALCVVGVGSTAALSFTAAPTYQATSSVYFSLPYGTSAADLFQGGNYTQNQVQSFAQLATMPMVLDPVIAQLGLDVTPKRLAGSISASASQDTVIVQVTASDPTAKGAADLSNAVADELGVAVRNLSPKDARGKSTVEVSTVGRAPTPSSPSSPKKQRNMMVGLLGGLFLGAGLAVLLELFDTRIRRAGDIAGITNAPILGEIANDRAIVHRPLVVRDLPSGPSAEAFRRLRTNVEFLGVDTRPLALVVTSSLANEGKSTIVANLAIACAEVGDRVLLVDADLRKPTIAQYLGIEGAAGLTTILTGRATFDEVVQPWSTGGANTLDVVTSGEVPPNPSELLASRAMETFIQTVQTQYDLVLFDSAPLLPVTDAAVLAHSVSGAVVVASAKSVHRGELADAIGSVEQIGARVLGVVLNGAPARTLHSYQGYISEPGRVSAPSSDADRKASARS